MKMNRDNKTKTKRIALIFMMFMMLAAIVVMTTLITGADSFFNIRVNYVFITGFDPDTGDPITTPAHDPFIAVYPEEDFSDPSTEPIVVDVTNPVIPGYMPVSNPDGGGEVKTLSFTFDAEHPLDHDVIETVYYLAGLSHYRVNYYKQNLYDDMYTRDNTLASTYTDRYGYTGSNPTDLEDINFPGFTNLFHEPDAIAADGSTVFRVYYDRNYYTVMFDLGAHGYGTDPVYAKYESVYHVTEPKRLGYTFEGWLMTDKDSSKLTYKYSADAEGLEDDELWTFIDENGDELLDGNGDPLFDEYGDPLSPSTDVDDYYIPFFPQSTIPAHDVYYKAVWDKGTTSYSVVYWIENPDGADITHTDLNNAPSLDAARSMIAENYTVVAAKDVYDVPSGSMINLNTVIQNADGENLELWDLFSYDLSPQAVDTDEDGNPVPRVDSDGIPLNANNDRIDFPAISEAKSAELVNKARYYTFNAEMSDLQFHGLHEEDQSKDYIEVAGDGTTRINVYYDRKTFNLKFFYARQNYSNGQLINYFSLTNSTKKFSNYNYYGKNQSYLMALNDGSWDSDIADSLPHIKDEYLIENGGILEEKFVDYYENGAPKYRYYYYEIEANYNEPLQDKWFIDAITPVHKKGFGEEQICYPGSWATEYYTEYMYRNQRSQGGADNFTIKGIYDRLGDDLMFRNRNTVYADGSTNFTELHFLLSWTNSSRKDNGWNYGVNKVLHFRYESYVELLPKEIELAEHAENGYQALVDNGTYLDVIERTYVDSIPESDTYGQTITKAFGLTADRRVETTDSGSQYPFKSNPSQRSQNDGQVRSNQTAAEIAGLTLVNFRKDETGKATLDTSNSSIDWSEDTEYDRHATIKFFYNRNRYTLKWRNGNRLEEDKTRDVMYGAPLNSVYSHSEAGHLEGEYRYWYNGDPEYIYTDLRDYYIFRGWYYTPYYYRLVDKDTMTMPANDVTLYAKWESKVINVSFYPTYNDYYSGTNRIADPVPVHYGDYVEMHDIPANISDEDDPDHLRPHLNPPADGAMFAGWYFIRDDVPVRFDPENVPITALNYESSLAEGARLRLYAEWATRAVGKYKITYIEQGHPENEVADPTIGRAFVWKTKTFNAKGGDDLNAAHAWSDSSINWWPTTKSHSLVILANSQGQQSEYAPNEYAFEYVQKHGVYYRVQYLDAASRTPLLDPADYATDEIYTTVASVKEDAPFIAGYNAEKLSQTMVLSASTAATEAEQKAEELETNVITFYYNKNERDYIYEVEYWEQDADDDEYTLIETENQQVEIAPGPAPTTVSLDDVYNSSMSQLILATGFTRVEGATKVAVTSQSGTTETTVADHASITITGDAKTTIKIYYNRNTYSYSYQYIDYHAEQNYNEKLENGEDVTGVWNGLIEEHDGAHEEKVDATVTIPAPTNLSYDDDGDPSTPDVPYTRIGSEDVTLLIGPNDYDLTANLVKVYYRKFNVRELQYKLVCKNEDNEFTEVDYDEVTGDPLYGGLSMTMQTVDAYDNISNVKFYNFNDATRVVNGTLEAMHQHRYTFLGWYDNPEGTGSPLVSYDENNPARWMTLTKADLGLEEDELPENDTTYYAVVEQVLVHGNFEFRYVDDALPAGGEPIDETTGETAKDLEAAEIVDDAPVDPDGSYTGSYFAFSDPYRYHTGDPLPYHKQEGYTVSILPKENDSLVYKYEFAEWWEEDTNTHKLIRKKGWNLWGEWGAPTSLDKQSDRTEDKHIIAVYKRRDVASIPYTIDYTYIDRLGVERTVVVKGTLSGADLDESSESCKVTNHGDFRLTDEFILRNAPYESNYGEKLTWSDTSIDQTSIKGDSTEGTEDRIEAAVTAIQETKTVHAHYRTTVDGEYVDLTTHVGDNYGNNTDMTAICAAETDASGCHFSHWEVRRTETGDVIAKSYYPQFDLCMMDDYYITPVYGGPGSYAVTLDPGDQDDDDHYWAAWTWEGSSTSLIDRRNGVKVLPCEGMTYKGLYENVRFIKVHNSITDLGALISSNSTSMPLGSAHSDDLRADENDGRTYVVTGHETLLPSRLTGEWQDTDADPSVTLTWIDYTRNRWTDENGLLYPNGNTDLLYSDFEIAFDDDVDIRDSEDYQLGVVYELCAQLPASATFDQSRDYNQVSDPDNLKAAISAALGSSSTSGSYIYNPSKPTKTRSFQLNAISTANLTIKDRIVFGKAYKNAYKVDGSGAITGYTNSTYLMKVTAYLIKNEGETSTVTLSNSVYICLKAEAAKEFAVGNNAIIPALSE